MKKIRSAQSAWRSFAKEYGEQHQFRRRTVPNVLQTFSCVLVDDGEAYEKLANSEIEARTNEHSTKSYQATPKDGEIEWITTRNKRAIPAAVSRSTRLKTTQAEKHSS